MGPFSNCFGEVNFLCADPENGWKIKWHSPECYGSQEPALSPLYLRGERAVGWGVSLGTEDWDKQFRYCFSLILSLMK